MIDCSPAGLEMEVFGGSAAGSAAAFAAAWAAIVGLPGTSGFFSKDEILLKAKTSFVTGPEVISSPSGLIQIDNFSAEKMGMLVEKSNLGFGLLMHIISLVVTSFIEMIMLLIIADILTCESILPSEFKMLLGDYLIMGLCTLVPLGTAILAALIYKGVLVQKGYENNR